MRLTWQKEDTDDTPKNKNSGWEETKKTSRSRHSLNSIIKEAENEVGGETVRKHTIVKEEETDGGFFVKSLFFDQTKHCENTL